MSKSKILKNTASYHDAFIESLKNPDEASLYLRVAMEEHQKDGDIGALLIALRNVTKAIKALTRPAH